MGFAKNNRKYVLVEIFKYIKDNINYLIYIYLYLIKLFKHNWHILIGKFVLLYMYYINYILVIQNIYSYPKINKINKIFKIYKRSKNLIFTKP